MRVITYSIVFATLGLANATCKEENLYQQKIKTKQKFDINLFLSIYMHNKTESKNGVFQISENYGNNKLGRQIKKTTSPEGSVELIEMMKSARAKKDAVKQKK